MRAFVATALSKIWLDVVNYITGDTLTSIEEQEHEQEREQEEEEQEDII